MSAKLLLWQTGPDVGHYSSIQHQRPSSTWQRFLTTSPFLTSSIHTHSNLVYFSVRIRINHMMGYLQTKWLRLHLRTTRTRENTAATFLKDDHILCQNARSVITAGKNQFHLKFIFDSTPISWEMDTPDNFLLIFLCNSGRNSEGEQFLHIRGIKQERTGSLRLTIAIAGDRLL